MASDDSFDSKIGNALERLTSRNVIFENGLTDAEVKRVEVRFGFEFPPDLRAFLQTALPVAVRSKPEDRSFPNWRISEPDDIVRKLTWPFEGIAFDIENNVFWLDEWGARPDKLEEALAIAQRAVADAPRLIPIYSHRYLPGEPLLAGNPILSVYQTDIIYYGHDLWDYFVNEFGSETERWASFKQRTNDEQSASFRRIRFWSEFG
jgi:hypothetical protein